MLRHHQAKSAFASTRFQRVRNEAFSLFELVFAAAILTIFASAAFIAMTISNRLAIVTRNQTQARSIVNERLNQMLMREWKSTSGGGIDVFLNSTTGKITESVDVWQYTQGGKTVKVAGTVETWTDADDDATNTRKVNVRLTYTFRSRTVVMESSTIRARDVN